MSKNGNGRNENRPNHRNIAVRKELKVRIDRLKKRRAKRLGRQVSITEVVGDGITLLEQREQ